MRYCESEAGEFGRRSMQGLSGDIIEPGANEFAIADSAIQSEFEQ